ncbi:PAS domain-containing protein [Nodularia harveyana UHCC-0300]|uniref:PAS domain-containing protein n=1 Tax=Nodularia harveyana UHCC-0300 TaxID=2974287 RepID=A0ABU5U8M7_9CYAN|nr:PAS domain-containing protein [Nodularia harveyana]MEA5579859.1 PAS domain-containing protein [Nodularia harveyana UHCC-0300]
MNIEQFIQSTEALHSRLADLYQTASVLPWIPPEMLPQAFKELYSTSKMVQLAAEELYNQNEQLIQTQNHLETESQHYQDLFELAPDGYLVTNTAGTIEEANLAAAQLLKVSRQLLIGQSIVNFVRLEEIQPFRSELSQLSQSDKVRELIVRLQAHNGEFFDAAFTVAVVRNQQGKAISLRWLVRNIYDRQQKQTELINNNNDLIQDRPIYKHTKGESILLNPLVVWYVRQGLVKLNTFCETGEEILIGLATQNMIFGSNMTSLPIYQATALSDVELFSISVGEITLNPILSHILLPKINQRLQQTEALLVIAGKRRVEERLYHLLQLFKQQIGETIAEGTRLTVRLTHEDIASACCTTRVTITRLMGKFQQQGLISFDSKKYLILKY